MKKDLHPNNYRPVVFEDLNNGFKFLTRSTVVTEDKTTWEDGAEYPLVKVHISSASHPFFTGQEKLMDIEGRVDKFKARQEAAKAKQEARAGAAKKQRKTASKPAPQKIGTNRHTPHTSNRPNRPANPENAPKAEEAKTA